jgi:hypothetical protein
VDWQQGQSTGPSGSRRGGIRVLFATITAIAVAVLAVLGAGAAAGAGEKASKAAVQTPKKSMWGATELNGKPLFPVYQQLGVGLYSNAVRWDQVAPTKPLDPTNPADPAYTWPQYLTDAIDQATAAGMQVQILILGTPSWANGGKSWQFVPDNFTDFGDFTTAISKKYATVDHWMIWGEPNRAPNFQPFTPVTSATTKKLTVAQQVAPRNYAQLLDAAYAALKAADPADKVIGGNTYTSAGKDDINPYQWIRYMKLPNGSRPRMDMWGHNPFGFDLPKLKSLKEKPAPRGTVPFSDLRFLVRELDRNFVGKKLKLFLAEWGVPTGFKDKDLLYTLKPKEAQQWVKAGYRIAKTYKRIFTLGWIHPVDTDRSSQGLLQTNGKRKPTFKAFQAG